MKILLASTALLASQFVFAAPPIDGWYASVFGGYAYIPNNVSKTINLLTYTDVNYESGWDTGGSFGYKSTPMRYEAELTYLTADVDHFRINNIRQANGSGSVNTFVAMANIYYDFPGIVAPSIEPYVGAGLGYGHVKSELKNTTQFFSTTFSGANSVFAYQGMAGLTFNFAENYAASIGYRYLATDKVDELGKIFQAHMANIGLTYRFDEVRYK
ncbi:opacity protein-like surface antigen (plasmid) [Legionella adelaidensis]|uniref:Opacity protein-like surface antigen n=1 Tax=Legionella adelaidensis TaxID=45056 RepID=A0A0W0R4C5_9GAMM|nr:outer membrane beta-barrel protein [Legionella adelaidensis]KTC65935.1 opacity protein-like surface antigen [Legionella adelaidensis]VEH85555.1 opacity protein-like surface antigen [Legionella adelaidensis]